MTRIREEEDLKTQSLSWSWRRFGCKCWSLMVTGRARADSLEPQQARLIDWSYVLVCCLLQVRSRHSLLTAFLYVTPFERRAALDLRCYCVLRHSCSRVRNTRIYTDADISHYPHLLLHMQFAICCKKNKLCWIHVQSLAESWWRHWFKAVTSLTLCSSSLNNHASRAKNKDVGEEITLNRVLYDG